jgi:hypothetical protein
MEVSITMFIGNNFSIIYCLESYPKLISYVNFVQGNVDRLSNYKRLDDLDVIPNAEGFECLVCFLDIEPGDGVVLRECLHTFCK